jgi:hypothetical protein
VDAVSGDEAAVTELVAAAEELARRLNQNGHFARTAGQLAELSTRRRRVQLRNALTTHTALMLQRRSAVSQPEAAVDTRPLGELLSTLLMTV